MSIQIEFDKPRTLKYGLEDIRDLEQTLGKPLGLVVTEITQLGVNALSTALWAGLKHEDRGLNLRLTVKLLEQYIQQKKSIRVLGRAVNDALEETGLFRNEDDDPNVPTETVN